VFVWLGGVLFVISLAWTTWWYVGVLGASTGALSWNAIPFDAALLATFALHHSVFARERVKAQMERVVGPALVRAVYVWTASVLLIGVGVLWVPVGGDLYRATGVGAGLHVAVQLAGVWLIVQSVRGIDALELAGIRHEAAGGRLQRRGPYALVRHPLYFGWVLAVFGAANMTGDRLAFAALTTVYLLVAMPFEERSLRRTFGDDYARYAQAVRWRLIPFIY
jgi:protein-S-isoprenylcysteine O-methyltransferase Ste14